MEFRLLGPVEVVADGQPIKTSEPRRMAVLAALLVDAGLVVPATTLVQRVWGEDASDKTRSTLGTHVTRIRRVLEQATTGGTPVAVVNESGGYRLAIDRDQVDLHRFRQLVDQAGSREHPAAHRVALLRQATSLWRGEPLTGLSGDWARRTREHLIHELLHATAAWATAEVMVDNPAVVLAKLTRLAEEYPLVEPLTVALVRALMALGRPTEALARCRAHRTLLTEEYGTEQGPELRAMYQAILREEPSLVPVPVPGVNLPVPAQLPAAVPTFAGRVDVLARLDATDAAVVAISGTAGVGKTSLALRWAHRNAHRFPDGQLYVDLGGHDPQGHAVHPSQAIRRFLDALDIPPKRIPADPDALAAMYRTVVSGRSMLLVLDNARDTAQVRSLLPGTQDCFVIVTSRNQLTGLVATDGAEPVALDLLTPQEGRQLLTLRLGRQRAEADLQAVDEIVDRCSRLPLALAVAAASAAMRPGTPLRELARELGDPDRRWQVLSGDDEASQVRSVFSWSYRALSPAAARLFRLLGLHPGPDIGTRAAASLAAVSLPQVSGLLGELAGASLLSERHTGRFTQHDLLRAYAGQLAEAEEPEPDRRTAMLRLLDCHVATAAAADALLYPHRIANPRPPLPPVEGAEPAHLADPSAALAWFTAECPVLLALLRLAAEGAAGTEGADRAYQLAWALTTFLSRQYRWHDLVGAWRTAAPAIDQVDDLRARATSRRLLGYAETELGDHTSAWRNNEQALDLYERAGDGRGQAEILHNMAFVRQSQGQPEQALDCARRALAVAMGTTEGQASEPSIRNGIACCLHQMGDFTAACAEAEQALALFRLAGDRYGEAASLHTLAQARQGGGQHAMAAESFNLALELCRQLGEPFHEATVLDHLGDSHREAGDREAAERAWREALVILDGLDHPQAASVRAKLSSVV